MNALEQLSDRLAFVRPPFDLANVAASADAFDAGLIVLDYIQRIGPPGDHGDRRGSVDATMGYLRQFADAGTALIVVAAVSRSKDSKGRSSYSEGLNLASFRESSELEFGGDDAFILAPGRRREASSSRVVLKHLKSRHGEAKDISLSFDRPHQRFTPTEPSPQPTRGEAASFRPPYARSGHRPQRRKTRKGIPLSQAGAAEDLLPDDEAAVEPSIRGPERLRR